MKIIIIVCEDLPGLSLEHLCASLETRRIAKTDDIGYAVSFTPESMYFDQHDFDHELIKLGPNIFSEKIECINLESFRKKKEEAINLIIEARNILEPFDISIKQIEEHQKKNWKKFVNQVDNRHWSSKAIRERKYIFQRRRTY